MQKHPNDLLYDAIVARLKKQYHHQHLRHKAEIVDSQTVSLEIWQDMNEIDLHWDSWNLWVVVYFQLIDEGLLLANDATPNLEQHALREIYDAKDRIQKSNLAPTNAEIYLAFEGRNSVIINLDLLAVHLTKCRIQKLSLDIDPQWMSRRSLNPQLTSQAKLSEEQAKKLRTNLIEKLKETFGAAKYSIENAIFVTESNKEPGVFRVVVELGTVNACHPAMIPDRKPPEDPFTFFKQRRASTEAMKADVKVDVVETASDPTPQPDTSPTWTLTLKLRNPSSASTTSDIDELDEEKESNKNPFNPYGQ